MNGKFHDFLRALMLPLYHIDNALPRRGKIIDLGCGEGIVTKHLAKRKKRKVIGIDFDRKRLPKSRNDNLSFVYGDIRKFPIKDAEGIVLSDVLHHMIFNDQRKVLLNIQQGIKKHGVLVIKEIDSKELVRSKLSRFWDCIFYPKDKIYYSNTDDFQQFLTKLGFKVKIKRVSRFFPGSTTLYICRKGEIG